MKEFSISSVSKLFTASPDREVIALDGIDLKIRAEEFVCILGPTGCGKTTLLRIIAGLENPTSGQILQDGESVSHAHEFCTLVFQQYSLFPWLNVHENVSFPMEMKGVSRQERTMKAKELLELVGLTGVEKAQTYELSGGMQQRVAIARALAHDPEILLMDEPFGALDERTRNRLQKILLDIWQKKCKTVIFVTHNIDEAIYLADRIIVMTTEPGRIAEELKVNLPRPRQRLGEEFTKLHLKIRKILEDSA
ncbi:nitrate ABC transporter ATP-binding protein [candidate division LCP-89 bacterium B3_LCP]|uniref:Nitrate ABC transporter ATP-binding protein n=1 Tax=candidate division LCP-89 bacterium B3_LCP TaxID=2012998 RepID=A0A532V5T1_UNCL8|nr:MAG: nitrate ABC transporter ATP-binding protein [candidate division LCP-89 bacterium B3_LCP]